MQHLSWCCIWWTGKLTQFSNDSHIQFIQKNDADVQYFTCVLKERHYFDDQIKFIHNMKGTYLHDPW